MSSYTFEKFGSENFGDYLLEICFKNDINSQSLLQNISDSFNTKIEQYYFNVLYILSKIGLFSTCKTLLNEYKSQIKAFYFDLYHEYDSNNEENQTNDDMHPFFNYYIKLPLFDINFIEKVQQTPFDQISNLFALKYNLPTPNLIYENKTRTNNLKYYCSYCLSPIASVKSLIYIKYYRIAYQILMNVDDDKRLDFFLDNFYSSIIKYDQFEDFSKFILDQDPEFIITGELFTNATNYFEQKLMRHNALTIYSFRHQYDEAARTAIQLFHIDASDEKRLYHIAIAYSFLAQALDLRHNPQKNVIPKYIPSDTFTTDIEKMLLMTDIQTKFCEFCYNQRIEFSPSEHDIIENNSNCVNVCALCKYYKVMNFNEKPIHIKLNVEKVDEIYSKLINALNIEPLDVTSHLAKYLSKQSKNEIIQFVEKFIINCPNEKSELLSLLVRNVATTKKFEIIKDLIKFEKNEKMKMLMCLENDLIEEAFELAKKLKDKKVIPLIQFRASQLGMKKFI